MPGLNAIDSSGLYGVTIEPSDQGVCAGNGFVMESNNLGEMRVYNTALQQVSADISLDSVMGLPSIPASMGGPWSSGGDVSCLFDYDHGGHWFITEFVSNSSWLVGGPFGGCFAGTAFGCFEGIAVSVSSDPLGAYNVYFVNANYNPAEPGYPYLLNDFAKIGNTQDAFLLFYDEFANRGGGIAGGFNGAQEFAINKKALELGFPVITPAFGPFPNPYFTVAIENMGFLPTPDGTCAAVGACWYQVIPAASPDPTQYDNSNGGSGFMLAPLDFFGLGDTRIAAFAWTGLSSLNSFGCGSCANIQFVGTLFSDVLGYFELGELASQKAGPIPLGDACVAYGLNFSKVPGHMCREGGISTGGDGFTQVSYAGGQIWGAISTLVTQTFSGGEEDSSPTSETHIGALYWAIGTSQFDTGGLLAVTSQSYVTAMHENIEYPVVAAGGTASQDGGNLQAVLAFSLSGSGGPTHADHGGYFPSTAYGKLSSSSKGLLGHVIHIADLGKAPQDGFTEYQDLGGGGTRPRWGDYNAAIFVPFSGGTVYFATQYIQSPNCDDATFLVDPSCGGTRDPFANWGTSVNFVEA
ncbi:MAG: hypothetical protein L3J97_03205 [Thermoplasmata archaeon]|nr:hypothetical protein [Thermoplasmata archaeon]